MRDPERIEAILAELRELWKQFPDWRLGQLIVNGVPGFDKGAFYIEDDVVLSGLRELSRRADTSFYRPGK